MHHRSRAGLLALAGALALLHAPGIPALPAQNTPPAAKGPPPPGPPREPAFVKEVDAAVERGVAWLRGQQEKEGAWGGGAYTAHNAMSMGLALGHTALVLYALRSSGIPADDPAVAKGFARLRELYVLRRRSGAMSPNPRRMDFLLTYEAAAMLFAIETMYLPKGPPPEDGSEPPPASRGIPKEDSAWIAELADYVVHAQSGGGSFGYVAPPGAWEDHSNAQFAILALKAAKRCEAKVPVGIFRQALQHFLREQEKEGPTVVRKETVGPAAEGYGLVTRDTGRDSARGWHYQDTGDATGSMTGAGVSTVVVCRGELEAEDKLKDETDARAQRAIRDGIAWLGHHFSTEKVPVVNRKARAGSWTMAYYLWSVERAGVLSGVTWMGTHDWYFEGARWFLDNQLPSGAWGKYALKPPPGQGASPRDPALEETCYALLFLKKAALRTSGAVSSEEGEEGLDLSGASALDDPGFAPVFAAVFRRYLRVAVAARGERASDFVRMGPRTIPLLVRLLEDESLDVRAAAIDALERVTGETLDFRPSAPPAERGDAAARWEEWWFARRGRLAPDAGSGRFAVLPQEGKPR